MRKLATWSKIRMNNTMKKKVIKYINIMKSEFLNDVLQDIFPDKATGRKILSLFIRCPSNGCDWTGELREKKVKQSIISNYYCLKGYANP